MNQKPKSHPILKSAAALTAASAASLWLALGDDGNKIKTDTQSRAAQATANDVSLIDAGTHTKKPKNRKSNIEHKIPERSLRDRVLEGDEEACEELFQKRFLFNKNTLNNIRYTELFNEFLKEIDFSEEELKATINGYTIKKWFGDIENEEMYKEAEKEFPDIEDTSKREAAYLDKRYRYILSVLDEQAQDPFNKTFLFQTGMTKEALQDRVRETFEYTIQHSGINSGSDGGRYERIEKAYEASIRGDSLLSSDPY